MFLGHTNPKLCILVNDIVVYLTCAKSMNREKSTMINFVAFSINIIFPNNLEPKYEFYDFSPKPKKDLWQIPNGEKRLVLFYITFIIMKYNEI